MTEKWKKIKEYDKYWISSFGRLKSYKPFWNRFIIVKPNTIKSGYQYYHLCKNGKRKSIQAHRLVSIAFLENTKNKPCVNHKDGNKQNNKSCNLEWVTRSENSKHAFKTGLITSETYSKITRKQVDKIRKLYPKFYQRDIAKMFNISQTQICRIVNGSNWILPEGSML